MKISPRQRGGKKDELTDKHDKGYSLSGPKGVNSLQVRIWARRKAIEDKQGEYALNVTGPILQFYEHYYNARYPLSKSGRSTLHQHT